MKLEIDSLDIWRIIKRLLEYPYPQICRHYVVGILVSELIETQDNYSPGEHYDAFCKEAVKAHDYEALVELKAIMENDSK